MTREFSTLFILLICSLSFPISDAVTSDDDDALVNVRMGFRAASIDDFIYRLNGESLPACRPYNPFIYRSGDAFNLNLEAMTDQMQCNASFINEASFCISRFFLSPIVYQLPTMGEIIYPASSSDAIDCAKKLVDSLFVYYAHRSENWQFIRHLISTPRFQETSHKIQLAQYCAKTKSKWRFRIWNYLNQRYHLMSSKSPAARDQLVEWAVTHEMLELSIFIFERNIDDFSHLYRLMMNISLTSPIRHTSFVRQQLIILREKGIIS
jgi:hypothetical protein